MPETNIEHLVKNVVIMEPPEDSLITPAPTEVPKIISKQRAEQEKLADKVIRELDNAMDPDVE